MAAVAVVAAVAFFALSGSSGSSGILNPASTQVDVLVGHWYASGVSTDTSGFKRYSDGYANFLADGTATIEFKGGQGLKLEGTWLAQSKEYWPDVDNMVGYYQMQLKIDNSKYAEFFGAVTDDDGKVQLFIIMKSDTDYGFTFDKAKVS